jgi:hypothetical protein
MSLRAGVLGYTFSQLRLDDPCSEGEAGRHHCAPRIPLGQPRQAHSVAHDALALRSGELQVKEWRDDGSDHRPPVLEEPDRHRDHRKAVDEVHRAVERVDGPHRPGASAARLLRERRDSGDSRRRTSTIADSDARSLAVT